MLDKYLPPTDNLYKFAAITGLGLFFLSFLPTYLNFYLAQQKIGYLRDLRIHVSDLQKHNKRLEDLIAEQKVLSEKYQTATEELRRFSELMSEMESKITSDKKGLKKLVPKFLAGKQMRETRGKELLDLETKVKTKAEAVEASTFEVNAKEADIEKTKGLIDLYEERVTKLWYLSFGSMLAGLVLSPIGFIFWYSKVQRPADVILRNESIARTSSNRPPRLRT